MAHPYEWCESEPGLPVAGRQLNAEVLLARIDAWSSAPYASTGTMRWIGNRAA